MISKFINLGKLFLYNISIYSVEGEIRSCFYHSSLQYKQAYCAGCRRRPFTAVAPLIGKIHLFSKIVTFEPVKQFGCPSGLRISLKIVTYSIL